MGVAKWNPLHWWAARDGAGLAGIGILGLGALGAGICAGWALAAPETVPMPRPRPAMAAALPKMPPVPAVPLPRKRPRSVAVATSAYAQAAVGLRGSLFTSRATFKPMARPTSGPFSIAPTSETSAADLAALKQVLAAARKGKDGDADAAERTIKDPVAKKLAEWVILRSNDTSPGFQRYANFINANPEWPHNALFRRRAENALWNDGIEDAAVLGFFAHRQPTTAKGRYILAHALLAKGDTAGATALVRYAWRYEDCSEAVESKVIETFGKLLTPADHKARMAQRFYHHDTEAGLRAAKRLGAAISPSPMPGPRCSNAPTTPRPGSTRCRPAPATIPATSSRARAGCATRTNTRRRRGSFSAPRTKPAR